MYCKCFYTFDVIKTNQNNDFYIRFWKSRITFSLYSLSNLEPVLKVRRALFGLALELTPDKEITKPLKEKLRSELSECWLLSAKVARKAGQVRETCNGLKTSLPCLSMSICVEECNKLGSLYRYTRGSHYRYSVRINFVLIVNLPGGLIVSTFPIKRP